MPRQDFQIPVTFKHRIVFTRHAFSPENLELASILREGGGRRALVLIEQAVAAAWPDLEKEIPDYFQSLPTLLSGIRLMSGGETIKADETSVRKSWEYIAAAHLDRHSYTIAIGGGAFLDAVGFAAATAHRGVRLIRFPTTTLSQNDSGVGVKCAINAFGKKNWIGAFSVPFAVINDFRFLHSQPEETRRGGLIEAVKVALVKDRQFFEWIEANLEKLAVLDSSTLEQCVERSAMLHASHIAEGGDPFECGSSRPLDYGHWAAHKIESLSAYTISHDHAVAVGLALDSLYSARAGFADHALVERVFAVLRGLKLPIYHHALNWKDLLDQRKVLSGLDEFREHLGGQLTLLMLQDIGQGIDVHEVDCALIESCIEELGKMA